MASASTKSTGKSFGALCRARSSIGPDMSTPSTWPDGATSARTHRRGAAAAADIDDALARLQLRPVDHEVGDRPEHNVLRRLPLGPALSGGTVPVGDLVGVLIVALGVSMCAILF